MTENSEIQQRLEKALPAIEEKAREIQSLLAHPSIRSEGSKTPIKIENAQYKGMLRLVRYLQGKMTVEELVSGPFLEQHREIKGVDPGPVPERMQHLRP